MINKLEAAANKSSSPEAKNKQKQKLKSFPGEEDTLQPVWKYQKIATIYLFSSHNELDTPTSLDPEVQMDIREKSPASKNRRQCYR